MLRPPGRALRHRARGLLLLLFAGLLAAAGGAYWAAAPVAHTGQLVDAEGRPVAGARVATAPGLLSPAIEARSDGAGRYWIAVRRWPPTPPAMSVHAEGFLPARTRGGRAVLRRWPRVSGQVLDDLGRPLAGATVVIGGAAAAYRAVMTDLEGRFDVFVERGAGDASLSVVMAQHDPVSRPLTLSPNAIIHLDLALSRQLGTLHLESEPEGLPPLLDGQPTPACAATPCDFKVLAGEHSVSLASELYVPWEQAFEVAKDGAVSLHARLERKTGTLALVPPYAGELAVDGRDVPDGGWTAAVPTGKHTATFRSAATWPALVSVDVAWNQVTEVRFQPAPVVQGDPAAFLNQLRAYLAASGPGRYGVYLEELGSGSALGVDEGTRMVAASVIKVPTALHLLRQVDAGRVQLGDEVTLEPDDFMGGTGSLYSTARPGDSRTYQDLLALTIQQSDNTAWKALDRTLGRSSVDAYAASIGAGDCRQADDYCSPRSAGRMLSELARGRLLSPASTQRLLGLLRTTLFNDRINFYLSGVAVAHKVGMDGGVINDCGVVYLARNPFTVCVFTETDDPDRGVQVIRDVARAAARYYAR